MAEKGDRAALLAHQLGTYQTLRVLLALIGFTLPLAVATAGWLQCADPPQWLAGSLSQYYHRTALREFFTSRDLLVGGLLGAAVCLYAYKGFSARENVVLNLAAIFAVTVALLPTGHGGLAGNETTASGSCVVFMGAGYQDAAIRPKLHGLAAILFFFCLAYVSIWRSRDTLRLLKDAARREWYNRRYVLAGTAMATSPLLAAVVALIADTPHPIFIFVVETIGVWAFCAYWALKSREMRETDLDAKVAREEVERASVASAPPTERIDRIIRTLQVGGSTHVERIVPLDR